MGTANRQKEVELVMQKEVFVADQSLRGEILKVIKQYLRHESTVSSRETIYLRV